MAARALPPDLFDYDGRTWPAMLCRGEDGTEWAQQVPIYWSMAHWARSPAPTPTGWPWTPLPWVQDEYCDGTFVPWFAFEGDTFVVPLILDMDIGYHLSRGADALMWPPRRGLGDMGWLADEFGRQVPGLLQRVSSRRYHPHREPPNAHRRFAIWRAAAALARRWRRRRWHRRYRADQARIAFQSCALLSAIPDVGTIMGAYLAGPPVFDWMDAEFVLDGVHMI